MIPLNKVSIITTPTDISNMLMYLVIILGVYPNFNRLVSVPGKHLHSTNSSISNYFIKTSPKVRLYCIVHIIIIMLFPTVFLCFCPWSHSCPQPYSGILLHLIMLRVQNMHTHSRSMYHPHSYTSYLFSMSQHVPISLVPDSAHDSISVIIGMDRTWVPLCS